jgi:hypothetical protein
MTTTSYKWINELPLNEYVRGILRRMYLGNRALDQIKDGAVRESEKGKK